MIQAGTHAISQGILGMVQGDKFLSAAAGGFFGSLGASAFGEVAGKFAKRTLGTITFGALSGGIGSELAGGNFWQGALIGGVVAGLNHTFHSMIGPKSVVAGIYGAGGEEASDNPRLKKIVEKQGGKMFTSSWGTNDQEIIDYLVDGYKEGKLIKIYGHSRGGAAAVRISNKLGEMNIYIEEVNLFDPVSLGGDLIFTHPNVSRVNNHYQRNPTDWLGKKGFYNADNPFQGSPVRRSAKYSFPIINQINYTGEYYKPGVPVSHLNIIRKAYGL